MRNWKKEVLEAARSRLFNGPLNMADQSLEEKPQKTADYKNPEELSPAFDTSIPSKDVKVVASEQLTPTARSLFSGSEYVKSQMEQDVERYLEEAEKRYEAPKYLALLRSVENKSKSGNSR